MNGIIREMKAKVAKMGVRMNLGRQNVMVGNKPVCQWYCAICWKQERAAVDGWMNLVVCKHRKLKVTANKSKVVAFEKKKSEVILCEPTHNWWTKIKGSVK